MLSSAQTSVQRFSGSVNPFKKQGSSTTDAIEAVHREKEKRKEKGSNRIPALPYW